MFELTGTFGKRTVGVVGGRKTVDDVDEVLTKLASIDHKHGTVSQIFDASRIAGKGHLVHAARLALMAHGTNRGFASSIGIELVCWTAGLRQIDRALERVGISSGCNTLAILTIGRTRAQVRGAQVDAIHELKIKRDDGVVELTPQKIPALLKIFSIPKHELKITDIQKLVFERMALLGLEKMSAPSFKGEDAKNI